MEINYKRDSATHPKAMSFLCHALSKSTQALVSCEPGQPIDVRLTVNGHDVPFLEVAEAFVKFNDEHTEAVAADMLEERAKSFYDVIKQLEESIQDIGEKMKYAIDLEIEKLFPGVLK